MRKEGAPASTCMARLSTGRPCTRNLVSLKGAAPFMRRCGDMRMPLGWPLTPTSPKSPPRLGRPRTGQHGEQLLLQVAPREQARPLALLVDLAHRLAQRVLLARNHGHLRSIRVLGLSKP